MTDFDLLLASITKLNKRLDEVIEKQQSPWMTRQECADYLKISVRQVYKLTQSGRLKTKVLKTTSPEETETKKRGWKMVRIHREWADQYVMFGKARLTTLERRQLYELCDPEKFEKLR